MAELNVCIFCGKEPEKPRVYGYQLTPRRNTCYCIDHSCGDGTFVSMHGYSAAEVVEKWNKIMPAADVAPVVRCKDCKWFGASGLCGGWCNEVMARPMPYDGFCSYGERKEGADNG